MDVMLLSCGTGGGHDAAAKALKEAFEGQGHHAVMMNPYTLRSEKTAMRINKAYIRTVQESPALFGVIYRIGEWYRKLTIRSPVYHINARMASIMDDYLKQHPVDCIITTHLFPAEILTQMRNRGMDVPPVVFVATDYTCIPFTEETTCDAYVIPTEKHRQEFINRGIPESKLYPLGIPTSATFRTEVTKQQAKQQLGLDGDKRYILVCGGSMGAGNLLKITKALLESKPQDTELIAICGHHAKLYARMESAYGDRIHLLRSTDQMALYLRASDIYLTKPGGLSSTEAAVVGIPLIHLPPIPGCETRNAAFFEKNGMSLRMTNKGSDLSQVFTLLENDRMQQTMIHYQRTLISSKSADAVAALVQADAIQEKIHQ